MMAKVLQTLDGMVHSGAMMTCAKCGAGVVAILGAGTTTKYLCDNGHSGVPLVDHARPDAPRTKNQSKKEPLEPTSMERSMERQLQREEIIQMMKDLAE